jgi:hypothetical protein
MGSSKPPQLAVPGLELENSLWWLSEREELKHDADVFLAAYTSFPLLHVSE